MRVVFKNFRSTQMVQVLVLRLITYWSVSKTFSFSNQNKHIQKCARGVAVFFAEKQDCCPESKYQPRP